MTQRSCKSIAVSHFQIKDPRVAAVGFESFPVYRFDVEIEGPLMTT